MEIWGYFANSNRLSLGGGNLSEGQRHELHPLSNTRKTTIIPEEIGP